MSNSPIAYALLDATDPTPTQNSQKAVAQIVALIGVLIRIFQAAAGVLLAYGVVALVLAMKDENAEAKVNATTQIGVAITVLGLSTILRGLGSAVGVSM